MLDLKAGKYDAAVNIRNSLTKADIPTDTPGRSHHIWLSARALEENNSGSEDLWLSATGAVVNGE
jgi:hypothetical protein